MSTRFGAIAGITQEELERDFAEEIRQLQQGNPSILQEIKAWHNGSARDALEQILSQQYLQPYLPDERKKIALGINCSSEERAVAKYEVRGLN